MRVAVVHSRFDEPGGAERYLLDLSGALAQAGHQVTLFGTTEPPPGPWRRELLPAPRPQRWRRSGSAVATVLRHLADAWPGRRAVAERIAATRPDVVHLHNWQHVGLGPVRQLAARLPVLHTVHDFALVDPTTTRELDTWSAARRALMRTRSAILLPQLRGVRLHWPAERTRQLAAEVDPGVLREPATVLALSTPATQELADLPPGEDGAFLFLGTLSEHKGLPDLLAAWAARPVRPAHARLLVAGDGPLRGLLDDAARRDPTIVPLGRVDGEAKRQALRTARWLVFPSRWAENFSISCVEALAAGRPIVSSAIARPPMASDGSVLACGSVAELATALGSCATMGAETYRSWSERARQDGRGMLWPEHVTAMITLLERTVGERQVQAADV